MRHRRRSPRGARQHRLSVDIAELYRHMAAMEEAVGQLVAALRRHDRDAVRASARAFTAAWSASFVVVGLLDVPNEEAREALRSARGALRAAGEIVDLLFVDALATAPRPIQDVVAEARARVVAALHREHQAMDPQEKLGSLGSSGSSPPSNRPDEPSERRRVIPPQQGEDDEPS